MVPQPKDSQKQLVVVVVVAGAAVVAVEMVVAKAVRWNLVVSEPVRVRGFGVEKDGLEKREEIVVEYHLKESP